MKIPIIATSLVKFGDLWEKSLGDLMKEAGELALRNAKLKPGMIDSLHIANAFSQEMLSALAYEKLGISNSVSVNAADASGAVAIKEASNSILSGQSNIAMVLGVEKMTDFKSNDVLAWTSKLLGNEEYFTGATVQSQFAMITRKYLNDFGLKAEDLWFVPSKNHQNGVSNEYAQYRFELKQEKISSSPLAADPIRMFECASYCDGAAALIMCSSKIARKFKAKGYLLASSAASDSLALSKRKSLTSIESTKNAAESAYHAAGISSGNIDLAEVHDIVPISEVLAIEDLGFAKKGSGLGYIKSNNKINPSGGLKACGNPLGATGVRQAIDVLRRLKSNKLKYGLTQTMAGTGSMSIVNIFGG